MTMYRRIVELPMYELIDRFNEDSFFEDNTIQPHFEKMDPDVDLSGFSDGELPISSSDITDWTNSSTGRTSFATHFSEKCSLKSDMNYPFKSREFENVMLSANHEREFKRKIFGDCPILNKSVTIESGIDSTVPELDIDVDCCMLANCDNKRMHRTYVNPSDVLPIYPPVLPVKSEVRSAIQTESPIQIRGTIADETVIRDGSRTPDSAYISDYLTSPPMSNSSQESSSGDYIDVEGFENSQVFEHNYSITRGCPQKSQSAPTSPTELRVSYSKSRCNSRAATSNRTQQSPAQPGRKPKKEMSFKPTGQRGKGRGRPNSKRVSDVDDLDKRQSHNFSERNRRGYMKSQFDDLKRLFPECLPDAPKLGLSKVVTLNRALEYIQQLENTGKKLQNELNFLQVERARLEAKWNSVINNRSFKQNYRH